MIEIKKKVQAKYDDLYKKRLKRFYTDPISINDIRSCVVSAQVQILNTRVTCLFIFQNEHSFCHFGGNEFRWNHIFSVSCSLLR